MGRRTYGQYCPVAHALDLLGERWTLLVVRDLLLGPLRYGDLLTGLPGISTDLLADRLRGLEAAGVIRRRRLPPPAGSMVYELTETGEELREAVTFLARWGGRLMGPVADTDDRVDHRWALLAMAAGYHGPAERTASWQLVIDDEPFALDVTEGCAGVQRGEPPDPALVVRTDAGTLLALASGSMTPAAARRKLLVELEGEPAAFDEMVLDLRLTFADTAPRVRTRADGLSDRPSRRPGG